MIDITGQQLKKVVPNITDARAVQLADMINFQCPKYGIDSLDILHEFISNLAHESGGFRIKEENLNYTAERLLVIFPKYFVNIIAARRFAHQPVKLANYVYGGRMGNKIPGDGWRCRGGGFAQLTGKDMYEAYRKYVQFDTIDNIANAVRKDDYYALDSACWFFSQVKNLEQLAIDDKFIEIVKKWNGSTIGLLDRTAYYERAKKYLV